MKYKRILLKLSGESLAGAAGHGVDTERLNSYARQIKGNGRCRCGNRHSDRWRQHFSVASRVRPKVLTESRGDQMGMLATVINSLALSSAARAIGAAGRRAYRHRDVSHRRAVFEVACSKGPRGGEKWL